MDFFGVLDQIVHLLRCRGRVSSHALKRQFDLDDAVLEDLKVELITSQGLAVEEEGNVLVWVGVDVGASTHPSAASPAPVPIPLVYIPHHLAQKILTSRRLLEGERKQDTVLFADMKGSTELIQDLDPEAAQQLLDPALHAMMDAVFC
jgi:hypothetical protein